MLKRSPRFKCLVYGLYTHCLLRILFTQNESCHIIKWTTCRSHNWAFMAQLAFMANCLLNQMSHLPVQAGFGTKTD